MDILKKLEELIKEKRPDLFIHLSAPLAEGELNVVLGQYASRMSDSLKSIWKWHNGQSQTYSGDFHSKSTEMLLSAEDAIEVKEMLDDYTEAGDVSKENWNVDWFPFLENGGGNYTCLSLNSGDIYYFDKSEVSTGRRFDTIEDWLNDLISGYEAL